MSRKKKNTKLTISEYEKLGRTLESIFEGGYINHWRVYKINFVRGIFFGLGVTLGGTILVALLVWILSLFGEVPFIGDFVQAITDSIDS